MNLKKDIYDKLIPYREKLYTACYLDYIRLTNIKDKEELAKLFKEHFKVDSGILNGCNRCLIRDCKKLGNLFFADEKEYKELELKSESIEKEEVKNNKEKKATNNVKRKRV